MFKVNDIVLYNQTDICRVDEICRKGYFGQYRDYYILKQVCEEDLSNLTIFVPVSADESRIRRLLSEEELRALLADDTHRVAWLESPLIRKKEYTDLLSRNNPAELIGLIRTLTAHRIDLQGVGRKLSEADEKYISAAEKKLYPLFKHILGCDWEEFVRIVTGA